MLNLLPTPQTLHSSENGLGLIQELDHRAACIDLLQMERNGGIQWKKLFGWCLTGALWVWEGGHHSREDHAQMKSGSSSPSSFTNFGLLIFFPRAGETNCGVWVLQDCPKWGHSPNTRVQGAGGCAGCHSPYGVQAFSVPGCSLAVSRITLLGSWHYFSL